MVDAGAERRSWRAWWARLLRQVVVGCLAIAVALRLSQLPLGLAGPLVGWFAGGLVIGALLRNAVTAATVAVVAPLATGMAVSVLQPMSLGTLLLALAVTTISAVAGAGVVVAIWPARRPRPAEPVPEPEPAPMAWPT